MGERPWFSKIIIAILVLGLLAVLTYLAPLTLMAPLLRAGPAARAATVPPPSISRSAPRPSISAPAEVFGEASKRGSNNCLFEAVIAAGNIRSKEGHPANPQRLRDLCMKALKEDPLGASEEVPDDGAVRVVDAVADGEVTGGEYLVILSKILRIKIHVNIVDSTEQRGWMREPIAYDSEIAEDPTVPIIHIRHVGHADAGHWTASPAPCPYEKFGCVKPK